MMTPDEIERQVHEISSALKLKDTEFQVDQSGKWVHILISTPTFEGMTASQRDNLIWKEFEKRFDDETILAITQCYLLTHDERASTLGPQHV